MAKKDYYEILNAKKTDSEEVIKKNYKKLALKFHPDKATEDKKKEYEENFKAINEAYTTLSSKEKRRKYDMGEPSGFDQRASSQNSRGGFSDIFEELLRENSFGGGMFGGRDTREDLDLHYRITIEFTEAAFGVEKEISIKKNIICNSCKGTGSEDSKFETCKKCNGQGRLKINQQTPWGTINQTVQCDQCKGEGKTTKNKCRKCSGEGIIATREKVKIKIPKGIDNGQTIRIQNAGNAAKNGYEGDLFLEIQVRPHKIFKRDGFDLYMEFSITFSKAALGGEIKIPTLSKDVKVKLAKGTESGAVLRLKNHGISYVNNPSNKGDQFVNIIVKTPKKLNRAQIKLFKELEKLDK